MTRYRTGRHNHRTIYVQQGHEPARTDPQVGTMDTPDLGVLVVQLLNEHEAHQATGPFDGPTAATRVWLDEPRTATTPSRETS